MNERIKELIEQATSTVTVNHEGYMGRAYTSQEEVFDKEKFAELIVRECANVALEQKKWVEDMTVFDPRDKEWNLARIQQSQRIIDKIKEHFGVEQ